MDRDNFNFTFTFISGKIHKVRFVEVSCKFLCCKPFVQLFKGIINAIVKLAAFGVLYNYTSTISKEIWTLN
jgi:hypothetical protein